jgi:dynein heavy chain
MDTEIVEKAFESFAWPLQIQMAIMDAEASLDKEKQEFMDQLDREKEAFWVDMERYRGELVWVQELTDYSQALQIAGRLEKFHHNLTTAKDRVQSYKDRERLFELEQGDYDELEEIITDFQPFHHLWHSAIEYKHHEDDWRNNSLSTLNATDIENFVTEHFKDSYKMFKAFDIGDIDHVRILDNSI